MRRLSFALGASLVSLLVVGVAAPAAALADVGISLSFDDSLAPYGDWVQSERYGRAWAPRHVDHDWRPYTRGRWAYTDDDWTWVSDEEWGWATDHYGRWYVDPSEGWVWIPGEEWAPAWVAWRYGGGYVGWAPLPPGVDVFAEGFDVRIDPFAYSFIEERRMMDRGAYRYFVPPSRNGTYIGLTRNATSYARVNDRVVNRGIDVRSVEGFTRRPVPRSHIRDAGSAAQAHAGRDQAGDVAIFRPRADAGRPAAVPNSARGNVERPEQLARRQGQERQRLQSTELQERGRLRQIQENEVKHPPAASKEDGPRQPAGRAEPRPPAIDKDQLRARHDAEQKAQGEHEQREQQMLQQRQQREARAAAEARPAKAPPPPKAERPANPPRKQDKEKDKPGKD